MGRGSVKCDGYANDSDLAPLQATHAFAFICEEIELTAIGVCREVHFAQRYGRPMQKYLASHAAHTGADEPVDIDRIRPCVRIFIAHGAPHCIGMIRASDAGTFRWRRIVMSP